MSCSPPQPIAVQEFFVIIELRIKEGEKNESTLSISNRSQIIQPKLNRILGVLEFIKVFFGKFRSGFVGEFR
jgi:hypothetical protein